VHYCFLEAKLDATNMDAVTFCHKVIIGFTEDIRKRSNKDKS
jgi:hypothetical protein